MSITLSLIPSFALHGGIAPLTRSSASHVCMSGRLLPANLFGLAGGHALGTATTLLGQFLSHRRNPPPSRKLPCTVRITQPPSHAPASGPRARYLTALAKSWQTPASAKAIPVSSLRPLGPLSITPKELAMLDPRTFMEKAHDPRVVVRLPPGYVHRRDTHEGRCLEKYALVILKDREKTRAWGDSLIRHTSGEEPLRQKPLRQEPPQQEPPTPEPRKISLAELAQQSPEKWKEAATDKNLKLVFPETLDIGSDSREWQCYHTVIMTLAGRAEEITPEKQPAPTPIDLVALSRMLPDAWEYVATSPKFKVEIPAFDTLAPSTNLQQVYTCLSRYAETMEKQLSLAGEVDHMNQ